MGYSSRRSPAPVNKKKAALAVGGILAAVVAFFAFIALLTALSSVSQGDIGYGVGGGPFDHAKHRVKTDQLGPGLHVLGAADGIWTFPSNKTLRFQDFDTTVTTRDGKQLMLHGQMGFRFVGEADKKLAKEFVTGLGARKYKGERPGESNKGWQNFLDQLVSPEINATFKDQFGRVFCADFEPQCRVIDPRQNVPESNPEAVYERVSGILQAAVDRKLGGNYLQNIRIRVNKIDLPSEVQANINKVASEQAATKAAEQAEQTAKAEAKVIKTKAEALRENRDLIAVEVAKVCKDGCNLIVDATGKGVTTAVPAR